MKFWDYKKDKAIVGTYRGWINSFGQFRSRAYVLQMADGRDVGIWSNKTLTEALYNIPFGTYIRINFEGKIQPTGEKFGTNIFKVEVLEEQEGFINLEDEPEQNETKKVRTVRPKNKRVRK